jgi:hypothetical protein
VKICRGYGGFGALGHSVYHRELIPKQVRKHWEGKIVYLASSGAHTAAICDSGVDCFNGPYVFSFWPDCVCSIHGSNCQKWYKRISPNTKLFGTNITGTATF